MSPTLQRGDIVLVDTWAYKKKIPQRDDIVVFKHGVKGKTLIKRINLWPNGQLSRDGLLYVTGDNKQASQDSRYFGGIASAGLQGQAVIVLLNIDANHRVQPVP